ncbi:MAG TPA: RluA family pseudouridine synthase [Bryobacteraceae bacterium]|nr:RluA family pseudouridine synthase [Bryobacteraceae bacterium]
MQFSAARQHAGKRLDQALHEQFPEFSRSRLQDWIKHGRVLVNGAPERPARVLRAGDEIIVEPAAPPPLRAEPESIPLRVLYEDASFVAIDKPAGMVVHAGAGIHSGTLVNALLGRFAALSTIGGDLRPGIVHRLDRFTSGVILVAKSDAAHRALAGLFAGRHVEKTYLALVHGRLEADSGRIAKPIARDPRHRTRMTARLAHGRAAWTDYHVLRRYPEFTYLEVRIGTGRTHQIRVHLASIGHPVAGDRLYGAPAHRGSAPTLERFFLHAHRIRFQHPFTALPVEIVSPLPDELKGWMERL